MIDVTGVTTVGTTKLMSTCSEGVKPDPVSVTADVGGPKVFDSLNVGPLAKALGMATVIVAASRTAANANRYPRGRTQSRPLPLFPMFPPHDPPRFGKPPQPNGTAPAVSRQLVVRKPWTEARASASRASPASSTAAR